MDKQYWEDYYKNAPTEQKPSLFAEFVLHEYLKKGDNLIELGCGNGRDSIFFARNEIKVLATDQCEAEMKSLNSSFAKVDLSFKIADFTQLPETDKFNVVYSRFTLHSISETQEDQVLKWSLENLLPGGYLCIEARGHKNELYKLGEKVAEEDHAYIYNDHYRRFVEITTLVSKLEKLGFVVVLKEEKTGFAPFHDTDYVFMRVIAQKK